MSLCLLTVLAMVLVNSVWITICEDNIEDESEYYTPQHATGFPSSIQTLLENLLAGHYLQALCDILHFQSTSTWTRDLHNKMLTYLQTKGAPINSTENAIQRYLENLRQQPGLLLTKLRELDDQYFQQAMKHLLSGRKETIIPDISVDFELLKKGLLETPGGNRTLFAITTEKCIPLLQSVDCVEILSQMLRITSAGFLQVGTIMKIPDNLHGDIFRNLSVVFRDVYDVMAASTQTAVYNWMARVLKKSHSRGEKGGAISWVTAENLLFLGRYIVQLPVQEIQNIKLHEMELFISYDSATKQLDSVYDISPAVARAFQEKIGLTKFDLKNISTVYRLGLLVCFYDNLHHLDASAAQHLLNQMIKCNHLRSVNVDIRKLKSQLLEVVIKNQSLNESLRYLSDAVVTLTFSQLESLSPYAVLTAVSELQKVSGWSKSQIMILADKYYRNAELTSFYNISQLGALVSGISINIFYTLSLDELFDFVDGPLSEYISDLTPAQQHAVIKQIIDSGDILLEEIPGNLFKEVSLSNIATLQTADVSFLKEKELRTSQALFLCEFLMGKDSITELISTGQLSKGVTCEDIENMDNVTLTELFKNTFNLLSLHQIRCLATKMWKEFKESVHPALLLMLPAHYFTNASSFTCETFLNGITKVELDGLLINEDRKAHVVDKALHCLSNSFPDVHAVDLLGSLICHLPPGIIQNLSSEVISAAVPQLRLCWNLSNEQKVQVRYKLIELYGNPLKWNTEIVHDVGPLITLLSSDEISALAAKFLDEVLQIIPKVPEQNLPKHFLASLFAVIHSPPANIPQSKQKKDCNGIRAPSSDEIRKLSEANCFWTVQELSCISAETFVRNVDYLGSVACFSISQLTALKEKAKQVWSGLSEWKSYHIVAAGRIVLSLTEDEIKELNLSSVDSISAFSQQTEWTVLQAKALLQEFLKDSGLPVSSLKSSDLIAMGIILCSLNPSQISLLNIVEYSTAAARIGFLSCDMEILQELKKKAETVFGNAINWKSYILQEVGMVAAALNVSELKSINRSMMPYFQSKAISAIPPAIFKELSPEQIANMGPENAAAITRAQQEMLSKEQLSSLRFALHGTEESVTSSSNSWLTATDKITVAPKMTQRKYFSNLAPTVTTEF
ncbi:otoancorin isoform X2 [Protopterus annectens]|uniref:otoancorin isoform X2 n=1 Tax=Protopterus annectens TaxID=7888 RepID=UPI001CFBC320|nr:otoancorin isoform X2 [Protopterus annectens]